MWSRWVKEIIAIALGGALGSVLRFLLSSWVQSRTKAVFFPWGKIIYTYIY
jgi:fluoride ion exporter CrcB/FEX